MGSLGNIDLVHYVNDQLLPTNPIIVLVVRYSQKKDICTFLISTYVGKICSLSKAFSTSNLKDMIFYLRLYQLFAQKYNGRSFRHLVVNVIRQICNALLLYHLQWLRKK